jgi:DUF3040 family protein
MRGPGERAGRAMLSREDSQRLAQLERQLRRDDPDFCARMEGGVFSVGRCVPMARVAAGTAIWMTALILGVTGWWVPAAVAGLWAAAVVGMLVLRRR